MEEDVEGDLEVIEEVDLGEEDLVEEIGVFPEEEEIIVLGVEGVANFLGTSEKNIRQYIGKNLKYKRKYMIYRTLPCS